MQTPGKDKVWWKSCGTNGCIYIVQIGGQDQIMEDLVAVIESLNNNKIQWETNEKFKTIKFVFLKAYSCAK